MIQESMRVSLAVGPGGALADLDGEFSRARENRLCDDISHPGKFIQRPIAVGAGAQLRLLDGFWAVGAGDVDEQARFRAVACDEWQRKRGLAPDGVFAGERLVHGDLREEGAQEGFRGQFGDATPGAFAGVGGFDKVDGVVDKWLGERIDPPGFE